MRSDRAGANEPALMCFLSHKCEPDGEGHPCGLATSAFGNLLREALRSHDVELLIDPFGPGIQVGARIEAAEFHALLFLSCKESKDSAWCQKELEVALRKLVPVFVIRLSDDVPEPLRGRIVLDRSALPRGEFERDLHKLAGEIRIRAVVYKAITCVGSGNAVAERVADLAHDHPTAVAEFLDLIDRHCRPEIGPKDHFWLALALGRTRHPNAIGILRRWAQRENLHPLAQDGIREALEMLGCNTKTSVLRRAATRTVRLLMILFIAVAVVLAARKLSQLQTTFAAAQTNPIQVNVEVTIKVLIGPLQKGLKDVQTRISEGM